MMRLVALVAVVVAAGMSACEKVEYVEQMDAGVGEDAGTQDDASPACGVDTYPCPPYGTVPGTILEDLTFTGWIDDNGSSAPLDDPYRAFGFDYFYQLGRTQGAKFLLFVVAAGWCTYCRAETRTLPAITTDYQSQGFLVAQVLFEDNLQDPATKDFVQSWAESYNVNFAIGVDAAFKTSRYFDWASTPANMVIALRDMTVNGEEVKAMQLLEMLSGTPTDADLRAIFDDLLANSQ
jgi:hypothetical protein